MREASAKCVDEYVATVHDRVRKTFGKLRPNRQQKPDDRIGTMTER